VGHRLTRIYTRTGDSGETGLGDGSRIAKDAQRIHALGTVDELNSHLGVLLAEPFDHAEIRACLARIQHDLFDLGGELSIPGHRLLTEQQLVDLEHWLDRYNAELPPLKEFILPGGSRPAAAAHVARTVCRRAERALVSLKGDPDDAALGVRYLNRLSDLLFVLARVLNRVAGGTDVLWQRAEPRGRDRPADPAHKPQGE
jgi:cob(I)alamin adenosyltransferase